MQLSDFSFDLPPELVAQQPPDTRGASRLLALERASGALADRQFSDLPCLLRPGDLLVVNDSRVFPARLRGVRLPGRGRAECLLIRRVSSPSPHAREEIWEALVHPGQRLPPGSRLEFAAGFLQGEVLEWHFHGRRHVRLWSDVESVEALIDGAGHVPLPPYIKRADGSGDRDRYQTVYARHRGSVAAPTAGLHFSDPLLAALDACGVERAAVTLHVGYGTFQPIRVECVENHQMAAEYYEIGPEAAAALTRARGDGRRIVAVGTTTTRTLESLPIGSDGTIAAGAGTTDLFIYPGYQFRVISGLITNFHLPRSSLLLLVSAFAGREVLLHAYRHAVAQRYRFYSYGDAMVIL